MVVDLSEFKYKANLIQSKNYKARTRDGLVKQNFLQWGPNEGGGHDLDGSKLCILIIYMLYIRCSNCMAWARGGISPPVKVGGCGGAFRLTFV